MKLNFLISLMFVIIFFPLSAEEFQIIKEPKDDEKEKGDSLFPEPVKKDESLLPQLKSNDTKKDKVLSSGEKEIWGMANPMPTPRSEIIAIGINQKIYVIGGLDADGNASDAVEFFDTQTNTWQQATSIPYRLHHVAGSALDEKIYLVGGYSDGWQATNFLLIYDTLSDTWEEGPPMPTARGALTAQFVGDTLYAIGGANRIALSTNEAFDTNIKTWKLKSPLPTPREHLSSAMLNDEIYVIGGRQITLSSNLDSNELYNAKSDTWKILEKMPTPRGGLAASEIGGTIFVFGGETSLGTFDKNEQYIPGEGWFERKPIPTPRHGLSSVKVIDRIYVIGGGTEPGLSVSGKNEVYYHPQYISEFGEIVIIALLSSIVGIILFSKLNRVKNFQYN